MNLNSKNIEATYIIFQRSTSYTHGFTIKARYFLVVSSRRHIDSARRPKYSGLGLARTVWDR